MKNWFDSLENLYNTLFVSLIVSTVLPEVFFPVLLVCILPLSIYFRYRDNISLLNEKDTLLFFGMFLIILIGLFWCDNTFPGLKLVEKNLSYIVLPIVILPKYLKDIYKLQKTFVIAFTLISIYTMVVVLWKANSSAEGLRWYFEYIENTGFHPTYMAVYSLLAIVFLSNTRLFPKNKNLSYFFIVFFVLFLFFLASRIAILILASLLIFKLFLSFERKYLIGLVVVFLTGITLFFASEDFNYKTKQLLDFKGVTYYDNNNYGSVSVRVAKIKASLKVWEEHKWLGTGTGCLKPELVKAYRSKELECWPCSRNVYNPHNQYLHYLAEYGILGGLLFFGLLFFFIYNALKKKDYVLLEVMMIFLLVFLTESVLYRQKGITAFVLFTILIYRISTRKTET